MRVIFRQMFSGLMLAALAIAPSACGGDDDGDVDGGSDVDAGGADAGIDEVAPPSGSAATGQPASAGSTAGEQGAQPR